MNRLFMLATIVSLIMLGGFEAQAKDRGAGKHWVLNLVGSGAMYESTVPDIDGDGHDDAAICFDVELYDANNRRLVGTATDCLSMVTPVGTGISLVGTTYFHLPQGTLVTRGNTTVQPVIQNTMTPSGQMITHITGASGTGNAILWGSNRFAGAMGTVRLSGMVDMTNFAGNPGDPIVFDCLFVIDLY
ncbi:hypothetical protein [Ferrimonas sp. SCSIO 43195]|uniref:hypothetical protein n=1 Tax=Ferrimonas sp. SCSIO 43195 TaxID=2822844 RepID=UPI002075DA7D|nr:hypothetical protein [Ferrimonas sp. SCSIO 43195]USD35910.1 hypothetical protein J8Z22_12735 [Ferrimonas sp. SCSIO 43195]